MVKVTGCIISRSCGTFTRALLVDVSICTIDLGVLVKVTSNHANAAQIHIAVLHLNGDVTVKAILVAERCRVLTGSQRRNGKGTILTGGSQSRH